MQRTRNLCYKNLLTLHLFFAILILLLKKEGHTYNGTIAYTCNLKARVKRNQTLKFLTM